MLCGVGGTSVLVSHRGWPSYATLGHFWHVDAIRCVVRRRVPALLLKLFGQGRCCCATRPPRRTSFSITSRELGVCTR